MKALRFALVVVAGQAVGCQAIEQTTVPTEPGDGARFEVQIQPILSDGCASLDCHGDPGRALRLYAERGLRLSGALRDQPLTTSEVAANLAAIASVSPGVAADQHLLVLKPLATAAGGIHHVGGDLWPDVADPAYRCLRAWLAQAANDAATQQACTDAYEVLLP